MKRTLYRYADLFPGAVYTAYPRRPCTYLSATAVGWDRMCGRRGRPTWIWWDNLWTYRCRRHQGE